MPCLANCSGTELQSGSLLVTLVEGVLVLLSAGLRVTYHTLSTFLNIVKQTVHRLTNTAQWGRAESSAGQHQTEKNATKAYIRSQNCLLAVEQSRHFHITTFCVAHFFAFTVKSVPLFTAYYLCYMSTALFCSDAPFEYLAHTISTVYGLRSKVLGLWFRFMVYGCRTLLTSPDPADVTVLTSLSPVFPSRQLCMTDVSGGLCEAIESVARYQQAVTPFQRDQVYAHLKHGLAVLFSCAKQLRQSPEVSAFLIISS